MFSVNVLEHVPRPAEFILMATNHLAHDAQFRFVMPNYLFPYEPHLGVPTLFGKRISYRLLRKRLLASGIESPEDFWRDLSWPQLPQLRRELAGLQVPHCFSSVAMTHYINRAGRDPTFRERHPVVARIIGSGTMVMTSARLMTTLPLSLLPVMDGRAHRRLDA